MADRTRSRLSAGPGQLAVELERVEHLLTFRGPSVTAQDVSAVCPHERRTDLALAEAAGDDRRDEVAECVLVVVRDRLELRLVVGAAQLLPHSEWLGCVLLNGDSPPLPTSRPSWPAVESVVAASTPVCFTLLRVAEPQAAGDFVADLARGCTPRHLMSGGAPTLAVERGSVHLWPPGDPASVVGPDAVVHDVTGDYPADVVLTRAASSRDRSTLAHPVLGSLADALRLPAAPTWADYRSRDAARADRDLAAHDGLCLGPVDSQLVNPNGFLRRVQTPASTLDEVPGSAGLCRLDTADGPVTVDTRHGLRDTDVARLRPLRGVHVSWVGGAGPVDYCRVVVALAMAGVPLTCAPVPGWAAALVGPELLEVLTGDADLLDPMAREVRSIRIRRAAYARHSLTAWRRRTAEVTGAGSPPRPRVSVLLPTRRPENLAFALRQVQRQRGVDLELVLATHGHEPDQRVLREAAERAPLRVTTLRADADEPFGSVLNLAAERAGGDLLLKMDDDDWYGPDFVSDLLMARDCSGADLTGTMAELVYVEALDVTVRRRDATESYRPMVAGGTMLFSRECLAAVGGFRRMRRQVDHGLLGALRAAGGSIYRTHGHSYLLRRGASGHTWDPGAGYFFSRSRTWQQWRGFRPSELLEAEPADLPAVGAAAQAGPA